MNTKSRLAVLIASLVLVGTYFLPLWRIDLWAPQYPEGLVMQIWLSKLSGDVEVINGLNHYIGMAHIREEMFPEFKILPYIVGALIAFGLFTAAFRNRTMLLTNLFLFIAGGVVALYDFWKWGYEYGHNLDPKAPIQVPGMAYQPPVIGYKALLNFGAYSMPDSGGWLFIVAGLLVAAAVSCEFYFCRDQRAPQSGIRKGAVATTFTLLAALAQACTAQPEPIRYGQDACQYCKMTIVDKKFAAEIVTQKGRAFKFDDVSCMVRYLKAEGIREADLAHILIADFGRPGELIDARKATFVQGKGLKSPMMGNTAALADAEAARLIRTQFPDTKLLTWSDVQKSFD